MNITSKSPSFSRVDIGAAVVFAGFDGGSYSATITDFIPGGRDARVKVRYFPCGSEPVFASVVRADWHRLTRFGNAKFLVITPA